MVTMKIRSALRKTLTMVFCSLFIISFFVYPVCAEKRELVFVSWGGSWGDAAKKALTGPFEKETGIKVIHTGPPDLGKLRAMVKSGNVEWDVSKAAYHEVISLARKGFLEPIDYNIVDKTQFFPETVYEYACGGEYLGLVLAYRTDVFGNKVPSSWKDFWDVKTFPGLRSSVRWAYFNLEAALMADGVSKDQLYPINEERAWASLNRIKPHIAKWWKLGSESQNLIREGEVDMILIWNGRAAQLIHEGAPVDMTWNQGILYQSPWFVVKNAPNKKEAMEFLNFAGRPKNQALLAELSFYGPTNPKAIKYIDPKVQKLIPSHPENLKKIARLSSPFWNKNIDRLAEDFETWLMK
jgi:putative spermidine/putrescine transport system substrate-binding protein